MATSKLKTIKSTLKKAIDYIINPEKTDDGHLIYSHACSTATADIEMGLTAKQGTGRGDRIAYHLMQSFSPDDDISPEKALTLGIEFAQKVTGGNTEFVIATHIDKDHIHNHIIFNSVDYARHRKYHSDKKDKYRIRDINDEICKENNLSVLPRYVPRRKNKYKDKGIHKGEEAGWQNKLKKAIDDAILSATSFDEFLVAMEMEGYTIKHGKHIAFHAPGQIRIDKNGKERDAYSRAKSIGDDYTEDAIRARIENGEKGKNPEKTKSSPNENAAPKEQTCHNSNNKATHETGTGTWEPNSKEHPFYHKRINLLIDISKNVKAQRSKGYEQALVRSNINTLNKTMNYLIEHNIKTSEEFAIYADGIKAEYELTKRSIKKIDSKLLDLSQKIKFTQNYKKHKQIFLASLRNKQTGEFYQEHKDELALYNASLMFFKQNNINPDEMNLSELFERYKDLKQEKTELIKSMSPVKKQMRELSIIEKNIAEALGIDLGQKEKSRQGEHRDYKQHDRNDKRDSR